MPWMGCSARPREYPSFRNPAQSWATPAGGTCKVSLFEYLVCDFFLCVIVSTFVKGQGPFKFLLIFTMYQWVRDGGGAKETGDGMYTVWVQVH
jgi:hypothetical protein